MKRQTQAFEDALIAVLDDEQPEQPVKPVKRRYAGPMTAGNQMPSLHAPPPKLYGFEGLPVLRTVEKVHEYTDRQGNRRRVTSQYHMVR